VNVDEEVLNSSYESDASEAAADFENGSPRIVSSMSLCYSLTHISFVSLPTEYKTYSRKNDKTASPLRKFNKKRNAQHNKAAFKRMVDDSSSDSDSSS